MKIKRQNISEEYSTTVDWIKDFERDIEKNANFLESLRNRHYLGSKFSSIEEKMADIRDRVGFDLIGSSKDLEHDVVITAGCASEGAGNDKCTSCSDGKGCGCKSDHVDKHDDKYIELVSNMLNYIKSMAENENSLPGSVIVSKCMSDFGGNESMAEDGLSIDVDKLINYADALAKDSRRAGESSSHGGGSEYVAPDSDFSDTGVEPAEFSNRTSAV